MAKRRRRVAAQRKLRRGAADREAPHDQVSSMQTAALERALRFAYGAIKKQIALSIAERKTGAQTFDAFEVLAELGSSE